MKTDRQLKTSKGIKTKLPVIIGCNVFKYAANKFIGDYGETALELFECPKEIDPLFFSCIVLYFFTERNRVKMDQNSDEGEANCKRGWGSLHGKLPQRESESAIGPNQSKEKNGNVQNLNFPSRKNDDSITTT